MVRVLFAAAVVLTVAPPALAEPVDLAAITTALNAAAGPARHFGMYMADGSSAGSASVTISAADDGGWTIAVSADIAAGASVMSERWQSTYDADLRLVSATAEKARDGSAKQLVIEPAGDGYRSTTTQGGEARTTEIDAASLMIPRTVWMNVLAPHLPWDRADTWTVTAHDWIGVELTLRHHGPTTFEHRQQTVEGTLVTYGLPRSGGDLVAMIADGAVLRTFGPEAIGFVAASSLEQATTDLPVSPTDPCRDEAAEAGQRTLDEGLHRLAHALTMDLDAQWEALEASTRRCHRKKALRERCRQEITAWLSFAEKAAIGVPDGNLVVQTKCGARVWYHGPTGRAAEVPGIADARGRLERLNR